MLQFNADYNFEHICNSVLQNFSRYYTTYLNISQTGKYCWSSLIHQRV